MMATRLTLCELYPERSEEPALSFSKNPWVRNRFLACLLQIGTTEADLLNLSPGQVADTGTRRATTVGHVERGGTGCRLCFRCAGASARRSKLSRLASGADSYGSKLCPHCCWQLRI